MKHLISGWKKTLNVTTYNTMCVPQGSFHRIFRTRIHQRKYNQLRGYGGRFTSDIFFFKSTINKIENARNFFTIEGTTPRFILYKVKRKHTKLWICLYMRSVYLMNSKLMVRKHWLVQNGKRCKKHEIYSTETKPYSPWKNPAENSFRQVKYMSRHMIR